MEKAIPITAAALTGLAGLTWFNYLQMNPKPRPVLGKKYEVEIRKFPIPSHGHTLYGELLLPKGAPGKLPTVVCSHGFNGSYRYFRGFTGMALAAAGYAVYCFDFYGGSMHSKSGGKMTEMSIFTERRELNDVIAAVKALDFVDKDRLYLFGESQGGLVTAITAAQHNEDVRGIVLYYPAFCAKDDMLKNYPTKESLPEHPKLMGKKLGRVYYEDVYDFDPFAEAAQYHGPVLIVHGDADRVVNVSYGKRAVEIYDNARLEILPGQDHGFNAKGKKQAVKLVYDFLKKAEDKPMLQIKDKILNGDNPVLCFFGDSVTDGEFEFTDGFKTSVQHEDWAFRTLLKNRIRDELGKEITVINAGVGGNFSGDGLARIQTDVLDKKPDFCCVMFGTNDVTNSRKGAAALEEYKNNLREIVRKLRAQDIEVVLMTPGMLCDHGVKGFTGFWWFVHKFYEHLQKSGKMDEYVDGMRAVARELDVPLADVYAEWQKLKAQSVDTTALLINGMNHPNAEMHKVFADKLYDLIFGA